MQGRRPGGNGWAQRSGTVRGGGRAEEKGQGSSKRGTVKWRCFWQIGGVSGVGEWGRGRRTEGRPAPGRARSPKSGGSGLAGLQFTRTVMVKVTLAPLLRLVSSVSITLLPFESTANSTSVPAVCATGAVATDVHAPPAIR